MVEKNSKKGPIFLRNLRNKITQVKKRAKKYENTPLFGPLFS